MEEFEIYWSVEKNIPIILNEEKDALKLKNENYIYIAKDLRPVFLEEKHLIKLLFELDEEIYFKSIWCTKQGKYIVDGKPIKASLLQTVKKIENIDFFRQEVLKFKANRIMLEKEKNIFEKFITENREHLYYLLESKERDSEGHYIGAYPFVEETMKTYGKRIPFVSFSGGKDSTVVSHIVRKAVNNESILHIFGDTTLELPLTYKYIEEFKKENSKTPFFEEKNEENNFFDMCKEIGPPSRVVAWCCSIFKTGPMGTTLSTFKEDFLTFYGIRRKESATRKKYSRILKSTKIKKQLSVGVIIDWSDIDVWLFILTENIPYNDSYRQGFARVGCWVCPHKGKWSDFITEIYNNIEYKKWENYLLEFSKKIGKKDYIDYVKEEKWKLRRGGEGLEKTKTSILKKKECINEINSYNIILNHSVNDNFINLFKPFGNLSLVSQGPLKEMFVINKKGNALFKILLKDGYNEIKITLIELNDRYLYGKIVKQINKFNNCIYCQACNSTCSFNALSVGSGKYNIDKSKCINCLNCVIKFDKGCLVASALRTKEKE